jgi:TRAP-type mannitol/chloroaromatic compound transport system permease large subunit
MPIIEIFKGAAPYVICNVIVLISISLWGPLTTALPQLLRETLHADRLPHSGAKLI